MKLFDLFDEYIRNYHYENTSKHEAMSNISHYKKYFIEKENKSTEESAENAEKKGVNKDISEYTQEDIQNFVNYEYYCNYSRKTIFNRLNRLKAIFNYAIRKKYILSNPCNDIEIKSSTSIPKDLDYSKKFIRKLKKIFKKTKLRMYVYVALHTRT